MLASLFTRIAISACLNFSNPISSVAVVVVVVVVLYISRDVRLFATRISRDIFAETPTHFRQPRKTLNLACELSTDLIFSSLIDDSAGA